MKIYFLFIVTYKETKYFFLDLLFEKSHKARWVPKECHLKMRVPVLKCLGTIGLESIITCFSFKKSSLGIRDQQQQSADQFPEQVYRIRSRVGPVKHVGRD